MCSFSILPIFLFIFPNNNIPNKNQLAFKEKFLSLSKNHYLKIISFSFILFFISLFGISKLSVENSFVNYFKKHTEIYKGMKLIDKEFGGTTPVDIILNFKNDNNESIDEESFDENLDDDLNLDEDFFDDELFSEETNTSWFTRDKLNTISNIHNYLESRNEIGKVQSIMSLIEMANLINKKPLEIFELSVLYNEVPENYKENLIYPFLLVDENKARITARVRDSENINRKELIKDIRLFLESNKNSTLENYRVNGLLVLYNNMLSSLFSSQFKSLGFILLAIYQMNNSSAKPFCMIKI